MIYKAPLHQCYSGYYTTCHDDEPNYGELFNTKAIGATSTMADKACKTGVVKGRVVFAANQCVQTSSITSWNARCNGSPNVEFDFWENGSCKGNLKSNITRTPDTCDEFGNFGFCAYY